MQLESKPNALAGKALDDGEDEVIERRGGVAAVHAPNVQREA